MLEINILHLFLNANFLVKIIISVLLICSIISWSIIIHKLYIFNIKKKEIKNFENKFWSGIEISKIYQESASHRGILSGSELIFYSGFKEFDYLYSIGNQSPDIIINNTLRSMRISIYLELTSLETNISSLGNIGSISPYIGLLGTILGIINSFIGLSSIKNITLQTVAPGITEALISTAIALFTAIPSIMAFNHFSLRIHKFEQIYNHFTEELIIILHHQILSNYNNITVK